MANAKADALRLIERLPDRATTADILDVLFFKRQIEGLRDIDLKALDEADPFEEN
jgi:hypothetical protein